jgi:uncharacterized protein involved in exopolysaccharide biosynthesis
MTNTVNKEEDEITLKELIVKTKEWCNFLLSKWKTLFVACIIGGIFGFGYSSVKPINYTAKITFILEESKTSSSGFGGLASLAGQFGVDVGGGSGGSILSGDNILLYFKSSSLAKEVLLSQFDSSEKETLADIYSKVYGLNKVWEKDKKIGKIKFIPFNPTIPSSRIHDSLLQKIIESINTNQFSVTRPDKKASFIEVIVNMVDENLAKIYCERIVQRVVDRYIDIKIQRQKATVDKLQLRVDSIAALLRQKTVSGASLQNSSNTMDINPLYKTGSNVAVETTLRDKALLSTIFASVTQNLEVAKFTLSQETPVIQIIDAPVLPLNKNKISKLKVAFLSSFGFSFIIILFHVIKRLYENLMK